MIRIKDYIFNENEIVYINEFDAETLGIMLKGRDKCIFVDAHTEDIEYNYGQSSIKDDEYIELSNKYQRLLNRNEELKEENNKIKKDLEIEINSSNLKSSQIKTRDILIKKLQSAKDKTIDYVNKKLNVKYPVLAECEMETVIDLLEGE